MRAALARLKLSSMISNSMRFSLTGWQVGCTRNTSRPRTSSSMRAPISPSGKFLSSILPRASPRYCAIFSAKGTLARPLKTLSWKLLFMRKRLCPQDGETELLRVRVHTSRRASMESAVGRLRLSVRVKHSSCWRRDANAKPQAAEMDCPCRKWRRHLWWCPFVGDNDAESLRCQYAPAKPVRDADRRRDGPVGGLAGAAACPGDEYGRH